MRVSPLCLHLNRMGWIFHKPVWRNSHPLKVSGRISWRIKSPEWSLFHPKVVGDTGSPSWQTMRNTGDKSCKAAPSQSQLVVSEINVNDVPTFLKEHLVQHVATRAKKVHCISIRFFTFSRYFCFNAVVNKDTDDSTEQTEHSCKMRWLQNPWNPITHINEHK